MIRSRSAAILILTGSALALAAALPATGASARPVQPATSAAWRVSQVIAASNGNVLLTCASATSPKDAWAAGISIQGNGDARALIEHWDGASWQPAPVPTKITAAVTRATPSAIAASSKRNVWAFGLSGSYLRLYGKHWTTGSLPHTRTSRIIISSAEAFSPGNAWAFGAAGRRTLHPYAARFNGRRWKEIRFPGTGAITDVSSLSANRIWAVTRTSSPRQPSVYRWNGSDWQAMAVQPELPKRAVVSAILAGSASDVWLGGSTLNSRNGSSPLALRWNGTAWGVTSPSAKASRDLYELSSLAPDDNKGVWGLAVNLSGPELLWHYKKGAWTRAPEPQPAPSHWHLLQLATVPGTHSLWGVGSTPIRNHDAGLIVRNEPNPVK